MINNLDLPSFPFPSFKILFNLINLFINFLNIKFVSQNRSFMNRMVSEFPKNICMNNYSFYNQFLQNGLISILTAYFEYIHVIFRYQADSLLASLYEIYL